MLVKEVLLDRLTAERIWPLALGVFLIAYVIKEVRSYRRLSHFPGPWLASVSNLWYFYTELSGRNYIYWEGACEKYGSIVRIGPNLLLTSNEDFVWRMTAIRTPYVRNEWFKAIRFDADKEMLEYTLRDWSCSALRPLTPHVNQWRADPEKHILMRSKVSAGYSGKDNANMEEAIESIIWQLIRLIKRKYISTDTTYRRMDLAQTIQYFTLDVITSLSMTQPFGFIENDEDVYEYISHYRGLLPQMQFMTSVPMLNRLMRIPTVKRLAQWFLGDKVGLGKTKQVAREIISKRFGEGAEVRQDMIGSFIAHGLSLQECADESLIQIFAGSDTTSTTIRVLMMHIISHFQVQQRLLQECLSVNLPLTEIISDKRAKELPYLQACIKESLRVYPSSTGLILKDAPPGGDTLPDGTFIPGGTAIGQCTWAIHRNKSVYGPDAHLFRPERWLEATRERLAKMERTQLNVFGHGLYKCLGENIARLELNKVIFELVRRFEITLEDPAKPFERNTSYGLFVQTGMWVRIEEREAQVS